MSVFPEVKLRYLHNLRDTVRRAIRFGADEWIDTVAGEARRLTPRRTGAAGDSLEGVVKENKDELIMSVTSDIPYFGVLEYGSSAHIIEAKPASPRQSSQPPSRRQ